MIIKIQNGKCRWFRRKNEQIYMYQNEKWSFEKHGIDLEFRFGVIGLCDISIWTNNVVHVFDNVETFMSMEMHR